MDTLRYITLWYLFSLYLFSPFLTLKPLRLSIRLVVRLSSLPSFFPQKVKILEYGLTDR